QQLSICVLKNTDGVFNIIEITFALNGLKCFMECIESCLLNFTDTNDPCHFFYIAIFSILFAGSKSFFLSLLRLTSRFLCQQEFIAIQKLKKNHEFYKIETEDDIYNYEDYKILLTTIAHIIVWIYKIQCMLDLLFMIDLDGDEHIICIVL
ncbi:hypothetical protein ACJX0J_008676, partial [Zea mays]